MFKNDREIITITCEVEFTVDNLEKASTLQLIYASNGQPIGIIDSEGNEYLPIIALECNEGTKQTLTTDKQFREVLGIEPTDYLDTTGVTEPLCIEEE